MSRPRSVEEDQLLDRLSAVFSDVGYEGASLARLAAAASLRKASLYHRFPGGKVQMAQEVLDSAIGWFGENVLKPLEGDGPPAERLALVTRNLDTFYKGGSKACLLNMLSAPRMADGPFSGAIRAAFEALLAGFARLGEDAGLSADEARRRAGRAVTMIQGSLVLARGLGDGQPFQDCLAALTDELVPGHGGPTP